jgi:predicted ribosome quality control (RQC) complex YloA/Tae2 family protein
LRLPDKSSKPDRQTLLEAASLAAWHSKARNSAKVAVAYTQVKYVRKPRKFPAGKVLVEREKQLMVKPANPDDFMPGE